MNKTRIEWSDMTFNPVTGCLNSCQYCYARKIAERFGRSKEEAACLEQIVELEMPFRTDYNEGKIEPYPYRFMPTFHRYRLNEPQKIKKPQNIFVCSMADLFGDWVPEEWIEEVFKACEAAPQHNYLFLTKNPKRYCDMANLGTLPFNNNFWYGSTITSKTDTRFGGRFEDHCFLSIEPLTENLNAGIGSFGSADWIIIGAETGNRKGKIIPEKAWIDNIVETAALTQRPIFMKDSLIPIVGEANMRREFPDGLKKAVPDA